MQAGGRSVIAADRLPVVFHGLPLGLGVVCKLSRGGPESRALVAASAAAYLLANHDSFFYRCAKSARHIISTHLGSILVAFGSFRRQMVTDCRAWLLTVESDESGERAGFILRSPCPGEVSRQKLADRGWPIKCNSTSFFVIMLIIILNR